jgi:fructose/tagatose bisphosphate aldolase
MVVADVPLVLHGGPGIDDTQLRAAIQAGVCKVNVNTELRTAYRDALAAIPDAAELSVALGNARKATQQATEAVLARLGCAGLLDRPVGPAFGG